MSLLLNTPIAASIQGYSPININYDYGSNMASITFATIVGGAVTGNLASTIPITITAFEALAGATNKLKAEQAIANFLALAGGTYTIT